MLMTVVVMMPEMPVECNKADKKKWSRRIKIYLEVTLHEELFDK